jgi:hypothetical protein
MTKLLQMVFEKLGELPENRQDEVARELYRVMGDDEDEYHLTDAQAAEVERRVSEKKPASMSARRAEGHLRRMRA